MNTATREPAQVPNEPPSVDWLGRNLDCGSCVNQGLLTEGKCQLAFSCVFDRYAKRIDRFSAGIRGWPTTTWSTRISRCAQWHRGRPTCSAWSG
jgi:hypothetical protein